jgi:hypothetical protein
MLYGFREIQLLEDNNDDSARQTVDDYLDLEQIRKRNEELSLSLQKENDIVKIKIEKEYKSNILHDLDKLGINVKTLFPEPEYQSKYIVRKVSNSVALDKNSYFIRFIR